MDDRYKTAKTKWLIQGEFCRDSAISQLELIRGLYMPVHNITSTYDQTSHGPSQMQSSWLVNMQEPLDVTMPTSSDL
jgi:hypothetical protein